MSRSEDFDEHRCEIITKVPHFSDKNGHSPCSLVQHGPCHQGGFSSGHFSIQLYANGMHGENEGYVSAILDTSKFRHEPFLKSLEFSCVFSAVDASGEKRYPKTFVFPLHIQLQNKFEDSFVLPRILNRETLLSESDDLLPDDCLTLHIDVFFRSWTCEPIAEVEDFVRDSFEYRKPGGYVLHLDSKLGKHLIEESPYFRLMSETPMVEKQRGYTIFYVDEFFLFREVCFILEGQRNIHVPSVGHLRKIYAAADKYRVGVVIESCRGLLSTLLRAAENDPLVKERIAEDVPTFLELADTCNDGRLKEIVESFFQRGRDDVSKVSGTPDRTREHSQAEWRLEKVAEDGQCFVFTRRGPEERNFDFYQ